MAFCGSLNAGTKANVFLRITLAKAFTGQRLKSNDARKPRFLLAGTFDPSLRRAVAQTRGAVDYGHESASLISVR